MKQPIAVFLIIVSIFMFSACNKNSGLNEVTTAPTEVTQTSETTIPTETNPIVEEMVAPSQAAVSCPLSSQEYFSDDDVLLFVNQYPTINLVTDDEKVAQRITSHFSSVVNNQQITNEIQEILSAANEMYSPDSFWTPYTVTVNFDPQRLDNRILSLSGTVYEYAGGPHPNHYLISANYNMETGEELALDDILVDQNALDVLCDRVLMDFSNSGEDTYLFDDYVSVVADHFNPESNRFGSWYLSETGLCIYFSVYEVSTYAAGNFVMEYPYDSLDGILKSEYNILQPAAEDSNGTIEAQIVDSVSIPEKKNLGTLLLTDDGPRIMISSTGTLYDVSFEQGHWSNSGADFSVSKTLFKTNLLDENSFLMVKSILPETNPTLRIRYSTHHGMETKYLAIDYANESLKLLESAQ